MRADPMTDTLVLADIVASSLLEMGSATPLEYGDLSDSFAPTDTVNGLMRHLGSASDNISLWLSDGTLSMMGIYYATIEDSFSPTDSVSGLMRIRAQFSDTGSWDDLVSYSKPTMGGATPLTYSDLADSFVPTDSMGGLFKHFGAVADDNVPTDGVTAIGRQPVSFSDSLTLTDGVGWTAPIVGAFGDEAALVDAVAALQRYRAGFSDSAEPSDGMSGFFPYYGALADEFIPLDSFIASLRDGTLGIWEFAFGDAVVIVDGMSMRGWGITATRSCTPVKIIGPDGRAVKIAGQDNRHLHLRGE
jgi:hypothetical protein